MKRKEPGVSGCFYFNLQVWKCKSAGGHRTLSSVWEDGLGLPAENIDELSSLCLIKLLCVDS